MGAMAYKWTATAGIRKYYGYTIRISNYYDASEKQFKSTLLHEMIHYYIAVKKIKDTSSHGVVFRRMMKALNTHGWDIGIKANTIGWEKAGDTGSRKEQYLVMAVVTRDGRYMLTVVNPGYAKSIDKGLRQLREVKWHAFYITEDRFFSSFPKVRSLRGRIVTHGLFEEKTGSMKPACL